eukprot:maker-scaffold_12-snap-gene-3.13-mRNA-1 protein AED:0.01 eAED:0.01 QI:69/1/1/1/1/1/3/56/307
MSASICKALSGYLLISHSWKTFKLLKSPKINITSEESKHHLKFYTIFAFLSLHEVYTEVFLSWIPFYYVVKFVTLIYISAPGLNGTDIIFSKALSPKLKQTEKYNTEKVIPVIASNLRQCFSGLEKFMFFNLSVKNLTDDELKNLRRSYTERITLIKEEQRLRSTQPTVQAVADSLEEWTEPIAQGLGVVSGFLGRYIPRATETKSKSSEEFESLLEEIEESDLDVELDDESENKSPMSVEEKGEGLRQRRKERIRKSVEEQGGVTLVERFDSAMSEEDDGSVFSVDAKVQRLSPVVTRSKTREKNE